MYKSSIFSEPMEQKFIKICKAALSVATDIIMKKKRDELVGGSRAVKVFEVLSYF
jgi:hypothetical protein